MRYIIPFLTLIMILLVACQKTDNDNGDTTDLIKIDSLTASFYTVKAWDTTTITCFARGDSITYGWECDHGNFNGGGLQIRYAAGQCCVGLNTITCTVSNKEGIVSDTVKINVTLYIDD
ncbi:MAG: hypothetical protein C0591_10465 [Marinilabiliales bacterium]|nr:MAG: hypothetical protein C0591_10465 [Marinilabiliales bacterium]